MTDPFRQIVGSVGALPNNAERTPSAEDDGTLHGDESLHDTSPMELWDWFAANDRTAHELDGDRIDILERLGQGASGAVYRGIWRGESVAIKFLQPGYSRREYQRFLAEARVIAELRHPNIVSIYGAKAQEPAPYLVMEFVNGWSLDRLWTTGESVPAPVAIALAVELLAGLGHAHNHRVIHRDIKPGNLLIGRSGEVKLADFSLAKDLNAARLSRTGARVGTPMYMSPEQWWGVDSIDHRADLYSVGALLYALLSGTPPFVAESLPELAQIIVTQTAVPLGKLLPGASPELARLVDQCLAKTPDARPATTAILAEALQSTPEAPSPDDAESCVHRWLQAKLQQRRSCDLQFGFGAGLREPPFVGRDVELSWLETRLDASIAGQHQVVVLEALSGVGKTRLLDALAQRAQARGIKVFRGYGVDGAQHPFQGLQGIIHELRLLAREDQHLFPRMRERLGPAAELIAEFLPELVETKNASTQPSQMRLARERVMAAAQRLLESLGEPSAPALIIIDDCQWACAELTETIRRWALRLADSSSPGAVMVVAAWRLEDPDSPSPFDELGHDSRLRIDPLHDEGVRALLVGMAGGLPDSAIESAVRLAGGNPLIAASVILDMIERGILTRSRDSWNESAEYGHAAQPSDAVADLLARRLHAVGPELRDLLVAGAILGKRFTPAAALALLNRESGERPPSFAPALRRQLLVIHGQDVEFVHDKIREHLIQTCSLAQRHQLHRRAADYFAHHSPEDHLAIAYHYDAAACPAEALPHAMQAARFALQCRALSPAEAQYRIALRAIDHTNAGQRLEIWEGLAQVLILAAHYEEAANYITSALALAEDPTTRARLLGHKAELVFKQGDVVQGGHLYEEALATLGERVPRSAADFRRASLWETQVQIVHTIAPRLFFANKRPESRALERLRHHLFAQLLSAYYYGARPGVWAALWSSLRPLNHAERFPPTPELGRLCSNHGWGVAVAAGMFDRGHRYIARSITIHRDHGDINGEGIARMLRAVVLFVQGRYSEVLDEAQKAAMLSDAAGNPQDHVRSLWIEGITLATMGQMHKARAIGNRILCDSRLMNHVEGIIHGVHVLDLASEGAVDQAAIAALHAVSPEYRKLTLTAAINYDLTHGREQNFIDAFTTGIADGSISADGLYSMVYPNLAEALRHAHQRALPMRRADAKRIRRFWRRILHAIAGAIDRFPMSAPFGLRELAYNAAWTGHPKRARRLIDRAVNIAREQTARYPEALALYARAELGASLGWDDAQSDICAACDVFTAMGAGVGLAKAQQLRAYFQHP